MASGAHSGLRVNQAVWSKRPTYEEILRDMETDYKVKLPDRVALQFYDSFAMTQFRELQQQTNESEAQKDEHRQEAVAQAANAEGVGRHELGQFVHQLHQQSKSANTELINGLNASAEHHRRTSQEQAAAFARQMAEEQLRMDSRMRTVQSSIDALATQPRVPEARAPPVQGTDELRMHVDDTASRILGHQGQQFGQLSQHLGGLTSEMVRNMREQNGHLSEMLHHLAQGQQ